MWNGFAAFLCVSLLFGLLSSLGLTGKVFISVIGLYLFCPAAMFGFTWFDCFTVGNSLGVTVLLLEAASV